MISTDTEASNLPYVIQFAKRFAVEHEACVRLVQRLAALVAFQAVRVPFEIGRYFEQILIVDLTAAASTGRWILHV